MNANLIEAFKYVESTKEFQDFLSHAHTKKMVMEP